MGPGLGPVFGNFAAQAHGWRWTMWELLWIVGFVTILLWVAMPETSHSNILLRRAERLRAITGNQRLRAESEIKMQDLEPKQVLFDRCVNELLVDGPA